MVTFTTSPLNNVIASFFCSHISHVQQDFKTISEGSQEEMIRKTRKLKKIKGFTD
jgi:hypothetical protein